MSKSSLFALFLIFLSACKNEKTTTPASVSLGQLEPIRPFFESKYDEPHRPQFHFSPPQKWMNDPNGMFFLDGEWHLFYQFFPDSTVWGPMHWGHAVSRDLVSWAHRPIALWPDSTLYVFSGSAVVDRENASGFGDPAAAEAPVGKGKTPPVVAMYTIHDMKKEREKRQDVESQGIAFSRDGGKTWAKYAKNPVISNPMRGGDRDFRDPKLVFHEPSKTWICALAVGDHAEFWGSKNFRNWEFLSAFGAGLGPKGTWECPDFAPVETRVGDSRQPNGDSRQPEKKWLLIQNLNPGGPNGGSAAQYFVGDFDGKTFTPDPKTPVPAWFDWGKDNYATVSWSDVPASDGRRVVIGWMSNWQYAQQVPTEKWRSAMTLPRSVFLQKRADGGYFLVQQPVVELEKLRTKTVELEAADLVGKMDLTEKIGPSVGLFELELEFDAPVGKAVGQFGAELSNSKNEKYRVGFDASKNQFFSDRRRAGKSDFSKDFAPVVSVAPRSSAEKTIRMRIFFDAASAELFADGGQTAMTEIFFPTEDFSRLALFSDGQKARLKSGRVHVLRSIWR